MADVVERLVMAEGLDAAIAELPEQEQFVIRERVMKQRLAKDVAAELPGKPQPQ